MQDELSLLSAAELELAALNEAERAIKERSLPLLTTETQIFHGSLKAIRAVYSRSTELLPVSDKEVQKRAILLLTPMLFNALVTAWDSALRGYYGVSRASARFLDESTLCLMAVSLDSDTAMQWLKGTLKDTRAKRVLDRETAKVKKTARGSTARQTRLDKWLQATGHASEVVGIASASRIPDVNGAMVHIGPYFDEKMCSLTALLLSSSAPGYAYATAFAFRDFIDEIGPINQEIRGLQDEVDTHLQQKLDLVRKQ